MKRYQVRFHLAKGENHGKWQVKSMAGVRYYDPAAVSLTLLDCQLRNQPATAKKVYDGANKSVCAWIDCNEVLTAAPHTPPGLPVSYDPRVAPHWRNLTGGNIDGMSLSVLRTVSKSVFFTGERTITVGGLVQLAPPADEREEEMRMTRMRRER
jgi:hypothetical protein